jgi:hypothetical protein
VENNGVCQIDRVRKEEMLHRVQKEGDNLRTINRRKANWIDNMLRGNCLLKHVIEEKREGRSDGKTRKKT